MSNPINALTMGELAQVEAKSGLSLSSFDDPNSPKAGMFTALAWAMQRRVDPAFTYNQAEAMTLDQITKLLGLADETSEESAEGE